VGAVDLGPNSQRRVVSSGRAAVGHGQRFSQGSWLGWCKYNMNISMIYYHYYYIIDIPI